jgi:hypothetical protein
MTIRLIKITRSIFPDMPWHIESQNGEINEALHPDEKIREWVGGRPHCYFKAVRSANGWKIKQRWKGRPQYW